MTQSTINPSNSGVIAILGAGCAGLSAALRLTQRGYAVVLLEQADHVGGLAGGVHLNGNTYEYGPHTFHTTDPEILNDILTLMGDELIPYRRTILIKFLGNYFSFPLAIRDVLHKLPPQTVLHAGLSLVRHFVSGLLRPPAVETSETILKRYYGNVLYEIFFKTYITSVWGISPAEFSPAFARERIPRMNVLDALEKIRLAIRNRIKQPVQTAGFVENVEGKLYTTRKGFSLITERMAEQVTQRGGRIELNATVTRLTRQAARVQRIEYTQAGETRQIECAGAINTLAINEMVLMTEPGFDASTLTAARALKFRALVFVGLLVRRPTVLPSSFMYFRQHSFNRISDLAQFGFHITPAGCTLLVAEISCDVTDRAWTDEPFAKTAVIEDLIAEKLLGADEVIETHVFRARQAYPIYTLNYEAHLQTLLQTIAQMTNLETAGRQGRFQYVNTHIAMKMGYQAADRLIAKLT
ncbi:MAG: FAD-dependent oxidoreductase [Chloroflexi bacterium]|nr:FAD-dependent oxidoreductase [Chloroflexota bacterium]